MKPSIGELLLKLPNAFMSGSHRIDDQPYGPGTERTFDEYPARNLTAPLVLFWYGGSWRTGNRRMYRFVGHFLQSVGAHAFVIDYPKSPEQSFPGFIDDANMAIAVIRRSHPGRRVIFMGHSAGGHTALLAGMSSTEAVDGIIAVAAPSTLPEKIWRPIFGNAIREGRSDPRNFTEASQPETRFMLIHGSLDTIVRPSDSISLHARLIQAGRSSELRLIPLAEHILVVPLLAFGWLVRTRRDVRRFINA